MQQLGQREAQPAQAVGVVSQPVQVQQVSASVSATAAVCGELSGEVQTFIHKMASACEKLVKKYAQAQRNLNKLKESWWCFVTLRP